MLVPIVCFTCGSSVGHVEDLFHEMRRRLVADTLGPRHTAAAQASIDSGLQIDCTKIFEALEVHNDCCRTRLATAMIFTDYYN